MRLRDNKVFLCLLTGVLTFVVTVSLCFGLGSFYISRSVLSDEGFAVLQEVKSYIDALYLDEYDEQELYRAAAKGMTNALDPYTAYYTPDEFKEFVESTSGAYVGVGLVLNVTEDGQIRVAQVYEDSPGAQAGVQAGDILLKVADKEYNAETMDAAADALRGDGSKAQGAGSKVSATFMRDTQTFTVEIVRNKVHLKTVSAHMEENGVAYFSILSFDEDTDAEFKTAYENLKTQEIKSIMIDLRDNGGGDYYTVCRLAGMFLKKGQTVVYQKDKRGNCAYEYAEGYCIEEPVVILANEFSASASEVLIGALSGNGRLHSLVGQKTFGKGITQDVYSLKSGGGLVITTSHYYTPDDKCIHGIGFTPDVLVESGFDKGHPIAAIPREEDAQLLKALEIAGNL